MVASPYRAEGQFTALDEPLPEPPDGEQIFHMELTREAIEALTDRGMLTPDGLAMMNARGLDGLRVSTLGREVMRHWEHARREYAPDAADWSEVVQRILAGERAMLLGLLRAQPQAERWRVLPR